MLQPPLSRGRRGAGLATSSIFWSQKERKHEGRNSTCHCLWRHRNFRRVPQFRTNDRFYSKCIMNPPSVSMLRLRSTQWSDGNNRVNGDLGLLVAFFKRRHFFFSYRGTLDHTQTQVCEPTVTSSPEPLNPVVLGVYELEDHPWSWAVDENSELLFTFFLTIKTFL